jgi:hypothetical protein
LLGLLDPVDAEARGVGHRGNPAVLDRLRGRLEAPPD